VALLTCEQLVGLATEYLEDALGSPEKLQFEQHLSICPPCRGFFTQMRTTAGVAAALPAEPLTPELREQLLRSFRDWRVGR
jgi:predicted anti-sigma-YlaC factor YlaD